MTAIEFQNVHFSRAADGAILSDLTLTVASGEVLVLVGRSGAGKTTVLKLTNRLLDPQSGDIRVEGRSTRDWNPIALRRRVGYVLQDVGLFPHMTIRENIGIVPRLEQWPDSRIERRVAELLDLVGLPPHVYADRWPDELSGGQRQRVGVARALAVDPPILLMDEPFGALDPVTRAEMHREFRRIQARVRKSVIIVTHDMGEAFALGNRLGVLEGGRLIACDTPARMAASLEPGVRVFLDAVATPPIRAGAPVRG